MIYILYMVLLFSCRSVDQDIPLKGYYESNLKGYNAYGRDYLFFQENKFELIRLTDVENGFGVGVYEIVNDSIVLTFQNRPDISNPEVQYERLEGDDSIRLEVKVRELNSGELFENANILLKKTRKGAFTDATGKAVLSLLKSELAANDTLSVFFVGYNTQLIPINPSLGDHQIINVSLASGFYYFQDGETLKYPIKRNGNDFSLGINGVEVPFREVKKGVFNRVRRDFKKGTK